MDQREDLAGKVTAIIAIIMILLSIKLGYDICNYAKIVFEKNNNQLIHILEEEEHLISPKSDKNYIIFIAFYV